MTDILPELVTRFDRHMNALPRSDSKVNRLRDEILATDRANAALLPGLFTLTVPTGGGKTLASLGFALDHVTRHRSLGLRRIILPITSSGGPILLSPLVQGPCTAPALGPITFVSPRLSPLLGRCST